MENRNRGESGGYRSDRPAGPPGASGGSRYDGAHRGDSRSGDRAYPPQGGRGPAPSRLSDEDLAKIDFGERMPVEIFNTIAEHAAAQVYDRGGKNKRTQLRRFYDELVMWNERVQIRDAQTRASIYKEYEPFIKMMRAKVVYAKGRDHIDETFNKLFSRCVEKIDAPESLKRCKLFMEAFMGFYRAYDK
jgi:CRISPR-associated protein Csm2